MEEICKKIVEKLTINKQTISFMESCTGGFLANEITNIEGASNILKISLVTYSTEYKEKFGVDKNIINEYTVYSTKTAKAMSKTVADFAKSDIGVGVTGELGNTSSNANKVYYSIYFSNTDKYFTNEIIINGSKRSDMKRKVVDNILSNILEELNELYKH